MATQELIKSIEAKKLNKRSKLPLPEPPVTIPFGGLVSDIAEDGGMLRFSYLGELYHCPEDRLRSALGGGEASRAEAAAPAEPRTAAPAETPKPSPAGNDAPFQWQEVRTSLNSIFRAKVPGGWLVMGSAAAGRTLAFYPDPQHNWDGSTLA